MLLDLGFALCSAVLALVVLGSVRALPRGPDGRPALVTAGGTLLMLSWAGGAWLGSTVPAPIEVLPFLFVAVLGALALAVPIPPRGPAARARRRRWGLGPRTLVPGRLYWTLMVAVGAAVVAHYWADALV